ncbi:MAG TPA: hypothetical protein VLX90_02895, partial [Steroidobacteraceae bacterium]|nr:hypothetical protein [Steroidobacteraceae bacterium]
AAVGSYVQDEDLARRHRWSTSVSLEPEFQGRALTRTYSIDGDTLKLSGTFPHRGEIISFVITWTRVSAPASEPKPPN